MISEAMYQPQDFGSIQLDRFNRHAAAVFKETLDPHAQALSRSRHHAEARSP
jgi:hypothetical protein